jgi:hypothetical protein
LADPGDPASVRSMQARDFDNRRHYSSGYPYSPHGLVSGNMVGYSQKNGASALSLQRILGLKSYETAWTWLHKFRRAMVRPGRELLSGRVEVDECYIGVPEEELRGRGSVDKALVVVAVEESGKGVGRIRFRQIPDASSASLNRFLLQSVAPGSVIHTDGWLGYKKVSDLGFEHEVRCIFSTDDEAYTYNKKVNHLQAVNQHFMILKALENGVDEKRLADALSVDVKNIRQKRNMLNGICPEAIALLRHKPVTLEAFAVLRKMKPVGQVEAAEHMIAGQSFSTLFAKALLSVTKPDFLVKPMCRPKLTATSTATQEMLGRETEQLIQDLKAIENSYGTDVLTLTVCSGYLTVKECWRTQE